jgi:hypothetical protein
VTASSCPQLAFPKDRPRLLDKRDRAADIKKIDKAESRKVRARSGGRCEVWEAGSTGMSLRCTHKAMPGNHHLIFGIGRKNKGRSILAECRIDVCKTCHEDITGKVLVPWVAQYLAEYADTVIYRRRT